MIIEDPTALIVTRDGDLLDALIRATKPAPIEIRFDAHSALPILRSARFSLLVLDDEVLTESERGWMIDECRRRQPETPIVYVASAALPGTERMAETHGVSLCVGKPVDAEHLAQSIRLLRRHGRRRPSTAASARAAERKPSHVDSSNPGAH